MFERLSHTFSSVFSRFQTKGSLNEEAINKALDDVQDALIAADVPYAIVLEFRQSIQHEIINQKVLKHLKPEQQLIKLVHERLKQFLGGVESSVAFTFQLPSVVMVMGLQGSGKTTTVAKLAYHIQQAAVKRGKKRSILVSSVDFYRPAALDQLEILAQKVGVAFYRPATQDPVEATKMICEAYRKGGYDLLLLDTAGRLHIDQSMMSELQQVAKIAVPRYKLLVLDAMTGQESLQIARGFEESVGFDGAILTKIDSDTRGGAAFAFRYAMKKPIRFVGVGEKIDEFELFYPDRMAGRILGMGDMVSLIERAEERVHQDEQAALAKTMLKGKMTLQDFADQLSMMDKIGSMSTVLKYLPGAGSLNISSEKIEAGERQLKQFKAIISSMNLKERLEPRILDLSRKKRVAKGAGVRVEDVDLLIKRFEESQQYVKLFKKFGKLRM